MAWKCIACIGLAGVMAWQAQAGTVAGARREQADVFSADNGRLLYRETHYVLEGAASERWVLYRCPDARAFARKRVQAKGRPAAPDYAFDDGRDGYREGVRSGGKTSTLYVLGGREEETRRLAVPADGVIDAGFDAAVRTHWDELMRGSVVRMQFLVPSRKRFYPLRVQRVGSIDWRGQRAERLRMRLDTWFGFAVPDVTLVYGRDNRRLLEFNGTGNVRDRRGGNPQVRIAFEEAPQDASSAEVAAIRRLPLSGRCDF